ncbi:alpha/beta fold hydrolase [Mycolicibacterium cosmeticum]|uniref:alpha/beta fold hydrolase n=1 Tax=Mycolicibacterium cosmeticum TaxID=258533 RepID=UPI0030B8F79F
MVFIHDAWHGAWCWDEHLLDYFAEKGYRAIALVLRGYGNSPLPGTSPPMALTEAFTAMHRGAAAFGPDTAGPCETAYASSGLLLGALRLTRGSRPPVDTARRQRR